MSETILGRLNRVELRNAWQSEAQDFTPWLARKDNLALLGETLGIHLELQAVEQNVGPFRADMLCVEKNSKEIAVIENQLGRSDHRHLGQILTYSAVLKAGKIIWIAADFENEHTATLEWLNDTTSPDISFFGVQLSLYRIGSSQCAPLFHKVAGPNIWRRRKYSLSTAKGAESSGDADGTSCLAYLLHFEIADVRTGISQPIGQLLKELHHRKDIDGLSPAEIILSKHGMKIIDFAGERHLIVANQNPSLSAIFQETKWDKQGWKEALSSLSETKICPVRTFHGKRSRGRRLPLEAVFNYTKLTQAVNK